MIAIIINKFKNLDIKVKTIMVNGFKFAFYFCIFSSLLLLFYNFYSVPLIYYCGIKLFKASLMFLVDFLILGFGFDTIKKQID